MRAFPFLLPSIPFLLLTGFAQAGTITVPTSGKFLANFDACHPTLTYFTCPPVALMLSITTDEPVGGPSGYSIRAWLISDQSGQRIPMGDNFPFWISTNISTSERQGIFGYNGLGEGFPFPEDPAFWGADPRQATISVEFENTGLPFMFAFSPENSVIANFDLDPSIRWGGMPTKFVTFIPEPGTLLLSGLGLATLLARRCRAA